MPGQDERAFQRWYAGMAQQHGLNPDPDAPGQFYDYRAAFKAGAQPNASGHWPSQFKQEGHDNLVVGGFDTRTGKRVPGTPRAKSVQELIDKGWAPEDAARLHATPDQELSAIFEKYGLVQAKPQPQPSHVPGLLVPGNIDLTKRPNVKNPDGSMSSVYSMGIEDENPRSPYYGKQVLIPGVIPNGQGGYYTDTNGAAARRHYYQTGEHMGVFSSPEASDRYGEQVHEDYVVGKYGDQYKDAVAAAEDQERPVKSHVPQPPHPMAVSHEPPKAQPIPEPQP